MNWIGGARKRVRRNYGHKQFLQNKQPFNVNHISNKTSNAGEMKVTYKSRPQGKQTRYNTTVSQDLVGLQALNSVHKPENSMKVITDKQSSTVHLTKPPRHNINDIELPLSPMSQPPSALDFLEASNESLYGGDYPLISTLKRDNTLNAEFDFTFGSEDNSSDVFSSNSSDVSIYPNESAGFELMNKVANKSSDFPLPAMQKPTVSKLFQTFDSHKSVHKPNPFRFETGHSSSFYGPDLNRSVPPNPPQLHPPVSLLKAPARPKPSQAQPFDYYNNTTVDTERPCSINNSISKPETSTYDWNNPNWYGKRNRENTPQEKMNMKPLHSSYKEAPKSSFNNPLNLQALKSFHKSQTNECLNNYTDSTSARTALNSSGNTEIAETSSDTTYQENPMLLRAIPNMTGRLHSKLSTVDIEDTPTPVVFTKPHPFSYKATPNNDLSSLLSNKGSKTKILSAFEKMILNLESEECNQSNPSISNEKETNESHDNRGNDAEWMRFINSSNSIKDSSGHSNRNTNADPPHTCDSGVPDQCEVTAQSNSDQSCTVTDDSTTDVLAIPPSNPHKETSLHVCDEPPVIGGVTPDVAIDVSEYPVDQEIVLSQDDEEDLCFWSRPPLKKRRCIVQSFPSVPVVLPEEEPPIADIVPEHDATTSSPSHMTTQDTPTQDTPTNSAQSVKEVQFESINADANSFIKFPPVIKCDTSTQTAIEEIMSPVDCSVKESPPTIDQISVGIQVTPTIVFCNIATQTDEVTCPPIVDVNDKDISVQTDDDDSSVDFKGFESHEKLQVARQYCDNSASIVSLVASSTASDSPIVKSEKIRKLQEENQKLLDRLTNDLTYHCIMSKLLKDSQ